MNHPVFSLKFNGDDFETPGISRSDFERMTVQTRKQSWARPLPTPEWALDYGKLRSLIVCYYEIRAIGFRRFKRTYQVGNEKARLARARRVLHEARAGHIAVLDQLVRKYMELKKSGADAESLRKMEVLIEGKDTEIVNNDRGPGLIAAMVYLYYRVSLDSVGVAQVLRVKPPYVRQTMYRLHTVWRQMNGLPIIRRTPEELLARKQHRAELDRFYELEMERRAEERRLRAEEKKKQAAERAEAARLRAVEWLERRQRKQANELEQQANPSRPRPVRAPRPVRTPRHKQDPEERARKAREYSLARHYRLMNDPAYKAKRVAAVTAWKAKKRLEAGLPPARPYVRRTTPRTLEELRASRRISAAKWLAKKRLDPVWLENYLASRRVENRKKKEIEKGDAGVSSSPVRVDSAPALAEANLSEGC